MVHRVSTIWKRRQQGSAALITTIAVSSILVVLFVGITTIVTREIRQSINADNANRALYAAEAGVEDAVRRLADDSSVREDECNALNSGQEVDVAQDGSADVAWTCRTITTVAAVMTGRLEADESLNINLARGRSGIEETAGYLPAHFVKIEWNNPNDPGEAASPLINKVSSWLPVYDPANGATPWTGAAALEITSTWFEATGGATAAVTTAADGPINKSGLAGVFPVRTVVASPACTGANCTYKDFSPWNSLTYPNSTYVDPANALLIAGSLQSEITTKCGLSPEYSCTMPDSGNYSLAKLVKTEINNGTGNQVYDSKATFTNTTMLLRVRPRYRSASYRIQFFASDGVTPVYMPDGNATIDVTARSSNYFRRVQAKKQLVPSIYDGVFDNALFSGGDICKNMKIYRDYRGAPDYTWNGTAKAQNNDAGSNTCTGGVDSDV